MTLRSAAHKDVVSALIDNVFFGIADLLGEVVQQAGPLPYS